MFCVQIYHDLSTTVLDRVYAEFGLWLAVLELYYGGDPALQSGGELHFVPNINTTAD